MTKKLCFTVDVDRDANECVPGRREASSLYGDVRFTSSEDGARAILDMLDELGIKATFFVEARTLENIDVTFGNHEVAMHGLDHEDMTGELSGTVLSEDEVNGILQRSAEIIRERTGTSPKGFRAPYMRTNEKIMSALTKFRIRYDSSMYAQLSGTMNAYDINGITEIPVPVSADGKGKRITGYLWPMHEGTRTSDDFVRMSQTVHEGVLVIATHSWHIVESRSRGIMGRAERERNIQNVKDTIINILDGGLRASRMIDAVG